MIKDTLLQESINKRLLEYYRVLDGRPIYRIVWSPDELEVRKGLTREFYGSIFLREYMTVGPRPKYWYLNPCFILEKLTFIPNEKALKDICDELPGCSNGSYEPLYTFTDKNKNPLPLSSQVVDFVIYSTQNPIHRRPSDWAEIALKEEAEEVKYFEEELGQGERSPLFVFENSVFVSDSKRFKKEFIEQ